MPRLFAAAALLLVLAASTTAEEIAAADRQDCADLGFLAGTEAYGNCILQLREIRAKERQAVAMEQARFRGYYGWGPWYPHPYWW